MKKEKNEEIQSQEKAPKNVLGIVGFVLSIVCFLLGKITFCVSPFIGLGLSIGGFVMGKKKKLGTKLALAGIIISAVGLVASVLELFVLHI